jgi:hypothetical protein
MHPDIKAQGGVAVWLHIFLTPGMRFKMKTRVLDKHELYKDDDVAEIERPGV